MRRTAPRPARLFDWPAPRVLENPQPIVAAALNRATSLVTVVRDEGPESIGAILDRCDTQGLYALATVLACMVPDDRPVRDLLSWLDDALPVEEVA